METEIKTTADGSQTIYSGQFGETYHSVNGAIAESMHVFIHAGLLKCHKKELTIFEVGFGTGLNALLSLQTARQNNLVINYHSIELYPLKESITSQLEYSGHDPVSFKALHQAPWNQVSSLAPYFNLHKIQGSMLDYEPNYLIDLVYFDAFSPASQPELWSEDIFKQLYRTMSVGGILTTYCAKGIVRRTMVKAGFTTERLPGPPGKREMLRATK